MRSEYDATTFAFSIKLPSSVLLREYSLKAFLERHVAGYRIHHAFDMKDVLKAMLTPHVTRALNDAECTNASDLSVLLDVAHATSDDEVLQIPVIKV